MFKHALTLLATCSVALPVWAMGEAVNQTDTNGDGVLSVEEVQTAWPDITLDTFSEIDINSDGLLDEAEVKSAIESKLLPITEGN